MPSTPLGFNSKNGKQYKVMIVDDSSIIRIAEKKILLSEDSALLPFLGTCRRCLFLG